MVIGRLDRRSAADGRRNKLSGHRCGMVDTVVWPRRVCCIRGRDLRNGSHLFSQPHRFFDHDFFDALEFLLL